MVAVVVVTREAPPVSRQYYIAAIYDLSFSSASGEGWPNIVVNATSIGRGLGKGGSERRVMTAETPTTPLPPLGASGVCLVGEKSPCSVVGMRVYGLKTTTIPPGFFFLSISSLSP